MRLIVIAGILVMMLINVMAGMAIAAPSQKEMLLKGSWDATESAVMNGSTQYANGNASGKAAQLGEYTAHFETVMQNGGNGVGTTTENIYFTTSKGDTLYAQGVGLDASTETPGVNRIMESYTVTGGTGRFVGATGTFTVVRFLNVPTGMSSGIIQGSLVYPK